MGWSSYFVGSLTGKTTGVVYGEDRPPTLGLGRGGLDLFGVDKALFENKQPKR